MKRWLIPVCVVAIVLIVTIQCYPYPHRYELFSGNYAGKPYAFEKFDTTSQTEVHLKRRGPGQYFISLSPGCLDTYAKGISGVTAATYNVWKNYSYGKDMMGGGPCNYGWYLELEKPTCVYLYKATRDGPEHYFTIYFGDSEYVDTPIIKQPGCVNQWELANIPDAVLKLVTDNFPSGFSYTTNVKYGAILFIADDDPQDIAVLEGSDTNVYNGVLWWGEYRTLHGITIEYNPDTDTAI